MRRQREAAGGITRRAEPIDRRRSIAWRPRAPGRPRRSHHGGSGGRPGAAVTAPARRPLRAADRAGPGGARASGRGPARRASGRPRRGRPRSGSPARPGRGTSAAGCTAGTRAGPSANDSSVVDSVVDRARQQADHRVDHDEGRQLAAGQDVVADRELEVDERADPLVDALVAGADEDEVRSAPARSWARAWSNTSPAGSSRITSESARRTRVDPGGDRLRPHDHPGAAAVRRVVDAAMPAEPPLAEVVGPDRGDARAPGSGRGCSPPSGPAIISGNRVRTSISRVMASAPDQSRAVDGFGAATRLAAGSGAAARPVDGSPCASPAGARGARPIRVVRRVDASAARGRGRRRRRRSRRGAARRSGRSRGRAGHVELAVGRRRRRRRPRRRRSGRRRWTVPRTVAVGRGHGRPDDLVPEVRAARQRRVRPGVDLEIGALERPRPRSGRGPRRTGAASPARRLTADDQATVSGSSEPSRWRTEPTA